MSVSNSKSPLDSPTDENPSSEFHVLVVDDDPEILESIRYSVQEHGYRVSVAGDGNEAIAIVETEFPDLIVLDMMMPKRSGFLVMERLCQTIEDPIPVIMITANEGNRHREYAKMLGVSDYIAKPFVMERLLESIDRILKTDAD